MNTCDNEILSFEDVSEFAYAGNGKAFLIRFNGLNADPDQYELESSERSPLEGTNLTFYSNTTVPYSSNLFYEGIPFEFLRTYETEP